jgi:hypothetical protein
MSGFEIIILIGLIVVIATGVGYYMNYGQSTLKEMKKNKVTEQVEAMKKVVEAHDTLVEEINKISSEVPEGIVEEPVKKETKSEFPIEQPAKKKRKYYPKKKKTEDK